MRPGVSVSAFLFLFFLFIFFLVVVVWLFLEQNFLLHFHYSNRLLKVHLSVHKSQLFCLQLDLIHKFSKPVRHHAYGG